MSRLPKGVHAVTKRRPDGTERTYFYWRATRAPLPDPASPGFAKALREAKMAGPAAPSGTFGSLIAEYRPELRSDCLAEKALAEKARDALAALLASGPIEVCPISWEKYGRILATVWAGQVDVGEELVRRGLARPYDGGQRDAWCW